MIFSYTSAPSGASEFLHIKKHSFSSKLICLARTRQPCTFECQKLANQSETLKRETLQPAWNNIQRKKVLCEWKIVRPQVIQDSSMTRKPFSFKDSSWGPRTMFN